VGEHASAYPEFIGYKYASCLTCHYNGNGNGPLNDYGRALFAAEIAGRALAFGRTDEQLGEASGFLGSVKMPNWFQPGIKARYLMLKNNPPYSDEKPRYIPMQADFNVASFWREDQKLGFIGAIGYVPVPQRLQLQSQGRDVKEWISREHYIRYGYGDNWWFYGGMLDKVYGIRIIDHTAYSRSKTGLAQNDQAHGVIGQYIQEKWEGSFNVFAGNLYQDADLRQKGLSGMMEYEVAEAWRVGVSGLYSFNKYVKNGRFGVSTRYGLGHGAAVLLDTGIIHDSPKNGDAKKGYYLYGEAIQRLMRGYHFFMTMQSYKDDMTGSKPDRFTTGFGLLMFPAQRVEFRVELNDRRAFTDNSEVQEDAWALLAQAHISL
jgi:hypothetical protein